jgi:hypothetical protein
VPALRRPSARASTVHFDFDRDTRWIAAGGTIANFIAGTVFLAASRKVRRAARLRHFLWLAMTINLLEGGGYFLLSGFGNIEHWAVVIQGLQPAWAGRLGVIAIGAVSYWLVVWFQVA